MSPDAHALSSQWLLDPDVAFLNHGSFGACPRAVLDLQQELRLRLERQPVDFFLRQHERLLDEARETLARFVGADPRNLVPVTNATTAVDAILRSLELSPGDELLTTSHSYGACRNALVEACRRARAKPVVVSVPFPGASPGAFTDALLSAVTPRTRLALVDHVTSPTGLVLPLARLVRDLQARGVDVLVDGAHGPGMLPLELEKLGAAWYTGNLHKWCCAPKGAAFLWARPDRQAGLRSLPISHGYASFRAGRPRLHDEFDWTGTGDPTPFLCVPTALETIGGLVPGGWDEVRRRNRALALEARNLLCAALGVEPPAPDDMIGFMAAVPLPDEPPESVPTWAMSPHPLQERLLARCGVEVPITPWPAPGKRLVRVSAQLYNHRAEYERLADGLRALCL